MSDLEQPILEIYQTGPTTVVGFGGRDVLGDVNVATCRDELLELLAREQCEVLAFDLTGVKLIPSGLLGLLTTLREHKVQVHLYNPSADIVEVLEITRLKNLFQTHWIDIPRA